MGKVIMMVVVLVLLAGCTAAATSVVTADPKHVWCDTNPPRRPTAAELAAMDRRSLDALNAANMRQEQWCGRTP